MSAQDNWRDTGTALACLRMERKAPSLRTLGPQLPQHISIKYTERMVKAGVEPWLGNVGSYDNALPEKAEGTYRLKEPAMARGSN